ncbi:hypothetical protein J5N97_011762 [Dioscorea zingiberensis]|uniref:Uncharacterized protein n=1 Tax=Dioscorea zingiberensis TaxID=325984 RepID=A0A9D5HPW0_9LILI|nr:hypothetical protein J5N97_011762 [Dioscorea zingiberensis]
MKLARSRSRNRVFLCFGAPASDDNDEQKPESSTESSGPISDEEQAPSRRLRRSRPRRALTKVFRSAAFVSVLERIRSGRRTRSRSRAYDRSLTGSSSRSVDDDDQRTDSTDRIFLSSSLSSSSSSSSSSSVLSSSAAPPLPPPECKHRRRVAPERYETRKPLSTRENYHPATGLCLFVISFCVLLSFGRLCAIPWAATCLYFTPRRKYGGGSRPRACDVDVAKKRVVLEGLLERNQRA